MAGARQLSEALIGSWDLVSRHTQSGADGPVTPLPDDGIALVVYDRGGNFTAQFMKRERDLETAAAPAGANNSRTIGGYDAYFGTYVVDDDRGTVTQTLRGSLAAENVGQVLTREMTVEGDALTIRVSTSSASGEPLLLTLLWRRVA